jgi:BTB/POZ domain-containing protein KCTD9
MRRSFEETWKVLETAGQPVPRDSVGRPYIPDRMPNYDDEEPLGFSYFRCHLESADNSNLSLPKTFMCRSLFSQVSFANTDLSESRMCWNDFEDCDFSDADLSKCDLRASNFIRCKFMAALLRAADLRQSSFEDCDFSNAEMTGAVIERVNTAGCIHEFLSNDQQSVIAWSEDPGPEPPGG